MGRSSCDYVLPYECADLLSSVHSYLLSEEYSFKSVDGEMIYQKGAGLTMGPTFFRILVNGINVRVEAWMKYAILPGVYVGEIDNSSPVGGAVKGPFKDRMAYIESLIIQRGGQLIGRDLPLNPDVFVPMQYQQPAPKGKYCMYCGTLNQSDSAFCHNCGQKVNI